MEMLFCNCTCDFLMFYVFVYNIILDIICKEGEKLFRGIGKLSLNK